MMMKSMVLLSGTLLMLGACKSGESKAQANAVMRRYNRPSPEVWAAVTNALQSLDLRIDEGRHDALGGQLTGTRATGDAVLVDVKSVDETTSQVSVSVADGNRNMADIIHSQIGKYLGTGSAKSGFYGGNRWEGTFDTSLSRAMMAAERAFEAIGFTVSNREIKETSADMMARRPGSQSILLRLESGTPAGQPAAAGQPPVAPPPANGNRPPSAEKSGPLKVSIIVGTSRSEDNEEILQRFKTEFERFLK
jgi:hypothetical protein